MQPTIITARVGHLSYDPKSIIGRGSYGTTVFKGIHLGPVAVKRILRNEVNDSAIQIEVELMKKAIDHPNILRYYCTEMNDDFL